MPASPQPLSLQKPSAELSAKLQEWATDWEDDQSLGNWPRRLGKERGLYLLHGNSAYLWYLSPQGQVLVLDTDRISQCLEVEESLEAAVNAVAQASRIQGELLELLPLRPQNSIDCSSCDGTGAESAWGPCVCHGLGWRAATQGSMAN